MAAKNVAADRPSRFQVTIDALLTLCMAKPLNVHLISNSKPCLSRRHVMRISKQSPKIQFARYLKELLEMETAVSIADAAIVLDDIVISPQASQQQTGQIGHALIRRLEAPAKADGPASISGRFDDVLFENNPTQQVRMDGLALEYLRIDAKSEYVEFVWADATGFGLIMGNQRIQAGSIKTRNTLIRENDIKSDQITISNLKANINNDEIELAQGPAMV